MKSFVLEMRDANRLIQSFMLMGARALGMHMNKINSVA
jgi:hypothetical protein